MAKDGVDRKTDGSLSERAPDRLASRRVDQERRQAAERYARRIDMLDEVDPETLESDEDGKYRLGSDDRKSVYAKRVSNESDRYESLSKDDIELTEQGPQVKTEIKKEAAARDFTERSDLYESLSKDDIELTEQGPQVKDRAIKEAASERFERQNPYLDSVSRSEVQIDDDGSISLSESAQSRADRNSRRKAAAEFESQSPYINNVSLSNVTLTANGAELDQSVINEAERQAERQAERKASRQRQEQRQQFAQQLESGAAFDIDSDSGVDPASLVDDVDPQSDIVVEDGSLRPSDELQTEIVTNQIRAQTGEAPSFGDGSVVDAAAEREEFQDAVEQRIESQSTAIEDANLITQGSEISLTSAILNSRRFDDDGTSVEAIEATSDLLDGVQTSYDVTGFDGFDAAVAEELSDRVPGVEFGAGDVSVDNGSLSVDTPESVTIERNEISADGLSDEGRADLARRQLATLGAGAEIAIDPATPYSNDAFSSVNAALTTQLAGGALGSATQVVASSDAVDNLGDVDDVSSADIIAGLDPDRTGRLIPGVSAQEASQARAAVQRREQLLANDPQAVLEDISNNSDAFLTDATAIAEGGETGRAQRQAARQQLNQLESEIAQSDADVSAGDVSLSLNLNNDSNIRSINDDGRQAIAESVDQQLPNFDSSEVNVEIADGEILTSLDQDAVEQFERQAERINEIQRRNEIADQTERLDRREIVVDGDDVGLSDEGIGQARIDAVDAETGEGEIVGDINAQIEGRDLNTADVQVVRADNGGADVELSEIGEARLETADLSAVDAGVETQQAANEVTQAVELDQDANASINAEQPTLADLGVDDLTGPPGRRNQAISEAIQGTIGIDAPEAPIRSGLDSTRAAAGNAIDNIDLDDIGSEDGGAAGAATIALAAPEPVSTGTGAAVLGGLALGGGITAAANEIGLPDETPGSSGLGEGEIDIPEQTPGGQTSAEIEIPDETPGSSGLGEGEIDIPEQTPGGQTAGEIDVPEQTPGSSGLGEGEIDIPEEDIAVESTIEASATVDQPTIDDSFGPEIDDGVSTPSIPSDEVGDTEINTPDRTVNDWRDETTEEAEQLQEEAESQFTDENAVDVGFGVGVGAGTAPLTPAGVGVDTTGLTDPTSQATSAADVTAQASLYPELAAESPTAAETAPADATATETEFAQPQANAFPTAAQTGTVTLRPPRPDFDIGIGGTSLTTDPESLGETSTDFDNPIAGAGALLGIGADPTAGGQR